MLPDPNISETNISETETNHELNQLLKDLNTFPVGTNPNEFDNIKFQKISNFLASERSAGINVEDFVKIIKGAEFKDDQAKHLSIRIFLESERSAGIASKDFVEIIKGAEFKDDKDRHLSICSFLKSKRSVGINVEDFVKIIKSAEFEDEWYKQLSISIFLESERSAGIASKDFVEIIKGAEFKWEESKYNLIDKFLESERSVGINVEDFVEIIKSGESKDGYAKRLSICIFLASERSVEITGKDVIKMINETGIEDEYVKMLIIQDFINSNKSSAINSSDLANMIKEVGIENRADYTIQLCQTKFSSSPNYVQDFIDLTKALHPNEVMQCEFVNEFIKKNQINKDNVMGLKPFIEGLQYKDLALDLINNLFTLGVLVGEKDTLSLVKNRSKKQYAFLTEIVSEKSLDECISEAGIATLKATFGDNLQVGDQLITVSDLISYYDLKNKTPTLFAMLKPDFKKQLRDNFAPSAKILLYKPAELEKLNSLLSEEGVAFDVKSYFVENTKLCDYLKEKVGDISEIDDARIYKINFANFGIEEEEKKAGIDTLFNELLKSDNPDEAGVAKFFSDLLGIDLSVDDGKKLKIFFQQNKKELAHCFCDKELPKENFESLLTTLRDGCFANIGAQFKKMLYATMIKDEEAQILYAVADDKIFSGIINNHGSDIMVGNFSPINDRIINSYLLSPMALVTKLSEETMLTSEKSWEIIQKNLGDDEIGKIMERLVEKYPEISEFNQKAKEIASFLIVKGIVGEEKITGLESKNPKLKELEDFVYGRVKEDSIADSATPPAPSQEQEGSPEPSPTNLPTQDQDAPRVSCFNLFSCFRRQ